MLNTFTASYKRPVYVIEEDRLRSNLKLISDIADESGVEFILAFKAFAMWKTFPIFREYIKSTTASSLNEALLASREFGRKAHSYSPAYTDHEIEEIARLSSHLTFNSMSQAERLWAKAKKANPELSLGLRVNPEYSEVGTMLYNPCAPGTRFGINHSQLPDTLPEYVDGLHCHCHCESDAEVFERTLKHIEAKFSKWFGQIKWINFGGGHLVTRKGYNTGLFIRLMREFKKRYPHLRIIVEPGSAFGWKTGFLLSHVVDVVEDCGIKTAILDVSFTCHMPDCLEMPYQPEVRDAKQTDLSDTSSPYIYRLGGNSCLSGDFMGNWIFNNELRVGDVVIFEDMLHYTTVKTNMFNGISHPSLAVKHMDGSVEILREYTYEDYRDRMD